MNKTIISQSQIEYQAIIAKNIRDYRLLKNLTRKDFAKMLQISAGQYDRYEMAKSKISAAAICELCKILRVPYDFFFPEEDYEINKEVAEMLENLYKRLEK